MSDASPGLGATVARFEAVLATGEGDLEQLERLGEPRFLELLFAICARRLLRMGPAAAAASGVAPARLLADARRAAAAGLVGVGTPAELRRTLLRAEHVVRSAGAWRIGTPCWWEPLPERDGLEVLWTALDAVLDETVEASWRKRLAGAFGTDGSATGWIAVPGLLPAGLVAPLHRELEAAYEQGLLRLDSGTVGRGRISASRSDLVSFLDGLEAGLPERLPRLAALVQWSLRRLAPEIAAALPERSLHPPATAMLARYPGPSGGYDSHFDNPGGEADNGRELSLLLYLNPPEAPCSGGELALWTLGAAASSPPDLVAPRGGTLALFDARAALHQVRPLDAGPARWSLAIWLNRTLKGDPPPPALGDPSLTDLLLTVEAPPVEPGRTVWHELDDAGGGGTILVRRAPQRRRRSGVVATVHGAGTELEAWCRHHLAVGFDHLVLVFDRLDEAPELAAAERLRELFAAAELTVWSGGELAESEWQGLAAAKGLEDLLLVARRGAAPQAVASRQALNATVALAAARSDELGGAPLDWLVHLDADERFWLGGPGRGGASAGEHFATLSDSGFGRARYVNHEILLPGPVDGPQRFKRSPREARARLGDAGWRRLVADLKMDQASPRPYFNGYLNGKSAVASTAGVAAAGVHDWQCAAAARGCLLAGPAVLHFHFASAEAYCRKFLRMAECGAVADAPPFAPCRTEVAALDLVRSLRRAGAPDSVIRARLLEQRSRATHFSEVEVEILGAAGLIVTPDLEHWPGPAAEIP